MATEMGPILAEKERNEIRRNIKDALPDDNSVLFFERVVNEFFGVW